MSEKPPADPLDKSKMSFGAHLEELRTTLFKCLFALALGTLVGLMFGKSVVKFIQVPIQSSLKSFYRGLAEEDNLLLRWEGRNLGPGRRACYRQRWGKWK